MTTSAPSVAVEDHNAHTATLPLWQSHKKVRAVKIESLVDLSSQGKPSRYLLTPVNKAVPPFEVDRIYVHKHGPQPGWYYVVYEDGYKSASPAEAFEAGYTLIRDVRLPHAPGEGPTAAGMKRIETMVLAYRCLHAAGFTMLDNLAYDSVLISARAALPPESPVHQPYQADAEYSQDVRSWARQLIFAILQNKGLLD